MLEHVGVMAKYVGDMVRDVARWFAFALKAGPSPQPLSRRERGLSGNDRLSAKLALQPPITARAKSRDRSDPQGDAPAWGVSNRFSQNRFGTTHVRAAR